MPDSSLITRRLAHDLGYSGTGNRGGPGICLRDRTGTSANATWLMIGEPVCVNVPIVGVLATTGQVAFQAIGKSYAVVAISEIHPVAEATAVTANIQVDRCQGTEAAGAGDHLVAATAINAKATANTIINATVITAAAINVLAAGNRLTIHSSLDASPQTPAATTEYRGTVTIHLVPVTLSAASAT